MPGEHPSFAETDETVAVAELPTETDVETTLTEVTDALTEQLDSIE
ncbi:MAG: hypothetical protein HOG89_02480 [Candidatus Peribacter sp.]|jgi:hypothetical protein|nr:hypothetical protein [Candidatus Peribacter sp.]MBT4392574.1 hypothetical protein [Candidatus Peribacter sp.]MBT4601429.1 hypothetical protein [Candidatus Peribacter sp.]MBT5149106.1 hypothetical protein [Candidatus Peribacter sp.]MBT5638119.1 hypothetical protein [Candidatus Peribacter sp.]